MHACVCVFLLFLKKATLIFLPPEIHRPLYKSFMTGGIESSKQGVAGIGLEGSAEDNGYFGCARTVLPSLLFANVPAVMCSIGGTYE